MRSGVNQAKKAVDTATNTGAELGADANGISSTLTPFLTSELTHPQGYGQQDESAMLGSAMAGAGGADAGIVGQANQEAARTNNAGGFQAALAAAARERMKSAAGASEDIAAKNAELKQQQQQEAAHGLQGLYGTDTSAMLDSNGQVASDINAEVNADKSGWLQNTMGVLNDIGGLATGAGAMGIGVGQGQRFGRKS